MTLLMNLMYTLIFELLWSLFSITMLNFCRTIFLRLEKTTSDPILLKQKKLNINVPT